LIHVSAARPDDAAGDPVAATGSRIAEGEGGVVALGLAAAGDGDGPVEPHAAATRISARIAGDRR
jgi:hypothetical protein